MAVSGNNAAPVGGVSADDPTSSTEFPGGLPSDIFADDARPGAEDEDDVCDEDPSCWVPTPDEDCNVKQLRANKYVDEICKNTSLKLLKQPLTISNWNTRGCEGLFRLFYTGRFCKFVNQWTNDAMKKKGLKGATLNEFIAADGLEIAMAFKHYRGVNPVGERLGAAERSAMLMYFVPWWIYF